MKSFFARQFSKEQRSPFAATIFQMMTFVSLMNGKGAIPLEQKQFPGNKYWSNKYISLANLHAMSQKSTRVYDVFVMVYEAAQSAEKPQPHKIFNSNQ